MSIMGSQIALAGEQQIQIIEEVPTLGEWGMIAMFVVLGIVGVLVLRKLLFSKS